MNVIDELEEAVTREMKPVIAERDAAYSRIEQLEEENRSVHKVALGRYVRIAQLETALIKVHGIVAEYWGPCPGSVETLLTIRDAMGAKDWRPNVDYMPRLLTSSETPVKQP